MGFSDAIRVGASGAADSGYEVDRSLRFNKSEYHYLTRTPSSTGNQKVWTFSAWIKRTNLTNNYHYIYSANNSSSAYFALYFQNDNLYSYFDPGNNYGIISDREFRDVGAWFHLVHQVDAANTTQRVWINGEELSLNSGRNPGNSNYPMNQSGIPMVVGTASWWLDNRASDMYLAEVHYSDGNKYIPSDFAETDSTTGQWIPKAPSITYGTNGFYLNFLDNSGTTATTLGKDSSGNGNNFTPTNFSVAAGLGNDSFEDTPTNNFPILNPNHAFLNGSSSTAENGNLQWNGQSNNQAGCPATMAFPKTGKWYWEVKLLSSNSNFSFGIVPATYSNVINPAAPTGSIGYAAYGSKIVSGSETASWAASFSNSDNVGAALDMDNNEIKFYKNNSLVGTISLVSGYENVNYLPWIKGDTASQLIQGAINFGGNGFVYTPPTGFKALNSANLPDPTILLPNENFDTLLWSGDSANSRDITGLNFKPDWVWVKSRNYSSYGGGLNYNHVVWDALRGPGSASTPPSNAAGRKELTTNENYAEGATNNYTNYYGHVSAFNNNGFTLGKVSGEPALFTNLSGRTYVGWNWNAGDTDSKTYTVKVVNDGGTKYRFDNFGTSLVTLDLAEGGTYIFNMDDSSNASHPFSIGTAANGTVYTSGITYFLDGVSKTYSQYTSGFYSATTRRLHITVPASAPQLYYWCSVHSGMGGAINTNSTLGSSNFDGTVQATVKANPTAGFSIVSYNVPSGSGYSVGHGLGAVPQSIFVKNRDTNSNWDVYNVNIGNTKRLKLNTNDAEETQPAFNNQTPTSTVFYGLGGGSWHAVGSKMINYVFSEVAGYSKFGSYTGNGSSDGTFIFTGFRPAWVLIKNSGAGGFDWVLQDATRSTFNAADKKLNPNTSAAEQTGNDRIDILSNGFKCRDSSAGINASSSSYIYLAFAESPFKNARAR